MGLWPSEEARVALGLRYSAEEFTWDRRGWEGVSAWAATQIPQPGAKTTEWRPEISAQGAGMVEFSRGPLPGSGGTWPFLGVYPRSSSSSKGPTLMTSLKPSHFPKALPHDTITLRGRTSIWKVRGTHEFGP